MVATENGASSFQLDRDAWGRPVLTDAQGRQFTGIEALRAFPITDPRRAVSVCDADGNEILWIDNLDDLPAPLRRVLEEELDRRHFLPRIRRVVRIDGNAEPTSWEVETDRGFTTFKLRSAEDIRRLAGDRVLIVDSHAIRYLIPDVAVLDSVSRRLLARYI
jgi:hypothetical protein